MFSLRSHISGPAASTFWTSLTFWRHFGHRETFWKKSCGTWAPGKAQEPFLLFLTSILAYFSNSGKTQHLWGLAKKKIILPMKRAKFLILWSRLSGERQGQKMGWKGVNFGLFWSFLAFLGIFFGLFFEFRENAAPLRLGEKKNILPIKRANFFILWSRLSGEKQSNKCVERGSILAFFGHFWPF